MRTWLSELGGSIHPKLRRKSVAGLNGIYTTERIEQDEVVVEIPREAILGPEAYLQIPNRPNLTHERDQTLFAFLHEIEQREQSRFWPWISRLPQLDDFKMYHPIFARDEELQQLQRLNARIAQSLINFRTRIEQLHQALAGRFEFSTVLWASLIYLTRAFDGYGLVPVADMFNHHSRLGRGLIHGKHLKTGTRLNADDQVFISYGRHIDSLELWLHFGFVDPNSPAVIGCHGIQTGVTAVSFDADCYIDSAGPSPQLVEVCRKLAQPLGSPARVLAALHRTIAREISDCGEPISPLVAEAIQVCRARIQLLPRAWSR